MPLCGRARNKHNNQLKTLDNGGDDEAKWLYPKRFDTYFTAANGFPYNQIILDECKAIIRHSNPSYPAYFCIQVVFISYVPF